MFFNENKVSFVAQRVRLKTATFLQVKCYIGKMAIKSVKTIRALSRGITVIRTIEMYGATSLDALRERTGIPKTTLSRILLTLQTERLATQRIADGKWVPGQSFGTVSSNKKQHSRLVQAAIPELTRLCEKVIWPSDLSVRSGLRMVLVETSRPHTTLMFNKLAVGFEIDFLLSAPGRAYLAFCPDNERREILSKLEKRPAYKYLFDGGHMEAILHEVHDQGFGHRDSRWGGRSNKFRKVYDDGLDAIAVPIMNKDAVLGCANIVWIRSLMSREDAVARYLDDLKEAAGTISALWLAD